MWNFQETAAYVLPDPLFTVEVVKTTQHSGKQGVK
jgi:hypothetical protein